VEFTGERYLPEVPGNITLEHRHRYLMATMYARDKDVLDIASGEGYGSAILANVAHSVTGVDISEEAIEHARHKYVAHNLQFIKGSVSVIPLPDASVDLVVSFETIEHHDQHEEMLREIKRVLRPNGILYISSPDMLEYSIIPGYHNEYHVKELTLDELTSLLGRYFKHHVLAGQRVVYGSFISGKSIANEFIAWDVKSPMQSYAEGLPRAVYLIALASDGELPQTFSSILEGTVEDSDQYMTLWHAKEHLHECIEKDEKHTFDLQKNIYELQKHAYNLQQHVDELTTSNQAWMYRAEELKRHFDAQTERAQVFETQLYAILTSRSWRITRPLRWLFKKARTLLPVSSLPSSEEAVAETHNNSELSLPKSAEKISDVNCIQTRVSAYKTGTIFSGKAVHDVRIYIASRGNHFFQEIAALIQCGFEDIGVNAAVVSADAFGTCADKTHSQADLHLIIAPHEFFHFIPQATDWPHPSGLVWMLNTEQAHTNWFAGARANFHLADLILDMDCDLAERLSQEGLRAEHLPLGYSPRCRLFDGIVPIELSMATRGIPQRIRNLCVNNHPLHEPLENRPLDCCFFGNSVDRRKAFFAHNAPLFAKLHAYLRLLSLHVPLRVGVNTQLSTEATSSIVRRSKIALNIHQSSHTYFEWHRIVLQGIWQGALVLSEPCSNAWPFRQNIDYIAVELNSMADTLEYLLLSTEGRAFAEKIRCNAYTTLTTRCIIGQRLEELLQLYACASEINS